MYLMYLVYLVYLMYLMYLMYLVYLTYLMYLHPFWTIFYLHILLLVSSHQAHKTWTESLSFRQNMSTNEDSFKIASIKYSLKITYEFHYLFKLLVSLLHIFFDKTMITNVFCYHFNFLETISHLLVKTKATNLFRYLFHFICTFYTLFFQN